MRAGAALPGYKTRTEHCFRPNFQNENCQPYTTLFLEIRAQLSMRTGETDKDVTGFLSAVAIQSCGSSL